MLECVIEDDDVSFRHVFVDASTCLLRSLEKLRIAQEHASLLSGFVYGHCDLREFPLYLKRLVAEILGSAIRHDLLEPFALPFVTP